MRRKDEQLSEGTLEAAGAYIPRMQRRIYSRHTKKVTTKVSHQKTGIIATLKTVRKTLVAKKAKYSFLTSREDVGVLDVLFQEKR